MMIDSSMSRLNSHASASCSTPCALHRGKGRKHSHRMYMQPRLQSPPCVRQTSMMASEGKEGRSFNPFRNKKKEVHERQNMPQTEPALNFCLQDQLNRGVNMQDAAKKALEDMFGGKQDMLAAYDSGGGNSGKVRAIEHRSSAQTRLRSLANNLMPELISATMHPICNCFKYSFYLC